MISIADQLAQAPSLNQVVIPDLWQQQAVSALREGRDVVVQAPTGAGKTLIFEIWSNKGKTRAKSIYTVPTRALANDKLAEWRARGWDVGIATGDLAENLEAPILVATLETQKNRLIRGEGPALLVVDEYQMLGDADRGLNYELALGLAPEPTQLLLLSGSVANPQDVVKWLRRLGRDAILIRHDIRPVPLDEVQAEQLSYHLPSEIRTYWARLAAKTLAEDLGPLLIFAPRRQAAEALAAELARLLPNPNPLSLSPAQKQLAGEALAKLLKSRVTYHHSGLSYGARAGVIEPLAKAGQLRVVVATMGLAAGINFSLRSVALAGESYRRDDHEQPLRADEILQMFGRAGRRGIDETGYVIVAANQIRIRDGYPAHLARSAMVDWSALLGLMHVAAEKGKDPFTEAVRIQERLFSSKPIFLGVEESLKHPVTPCGLKTDAERARRVRQRVRQMLNSRGEWERYPAALERTLREVRIMAAPPVRSAVENLGSPDAGTAASPGGVSEMPQGPVSPPPALRPALSEPGVVEKVGPGQVHKIGEEDGLPVYGRLFTVAERNAEDNIYLVKWVRRLLEWHGRHANMESWREKIAPLLEKRLALQKMPLVGFEAHPTKILASISVADLTLRVPVDSHGVALWRPPEREVLPADCAACSLIETCRQLPSATGVAMQWRRLGLVDARGVPTRRGQMLSFFTQSDGLAIAAALEDPGYALTDLIYDLANLDASFRFCGDENRWGGRLALACQRIYGIQSIPGYLENGVPPKYGAGAEQVVAAVHKNPASKHAYISDLVGAGDIDRVIIEWRSLLRQIFHAPALDWDRWKELQRLAKTTVNETESPTLTDLPPLEFSQTRRVSHKLVFRSR